MNLWLPLLLAACHRAPCAPEAWADADGDGFGDPAAPACDAGEGLVERAGDCDDRDRTVHPGVAEACDGVDQDCDGWVDDHPEPPLHVDRDGDGFGSEPLPNCDAWGVTDGTDCDDADALRNPDTVWYVDGDGDGVGDAVAGAACEAPSPEAVLVGGDCDDADAGRFPGARERCDDSDDDCDPTNESTGAWMVPSATHRRSLLARGDGFVPLAVDVDLGGADPASVRVVVQDCGGAREGQALPASFVDGAVGLFTAGSAPDPDGDGVGAVVALWDEDGDLSTAERWPFDALTLAVYWGGPPADDDWNSDLEASDDSLSTAGWTATFDPARGGLLAGLVGPDGIVAGEAQATSGNGLRTRTGPLAAAAFPGTTSRTDHSPITGGVVTAAELQNGGGRVALGTRWRMFAGRPALLGTVSMAAVDDTRIRGTDDRTEPIRPFQLRTPFTAQCTTDPALAWADLSAGDLGITWAWVAPPRWVNFVGCAARETWSSANDLPEGERGHGTTGTVDAGVPVVDAAVFVVLPHGPGGAAAAAADRRAWGTGVQVTLGALED